MRIYLADVFDLDLPLVLYYYRIASVLIINLSNSCHA